MTKKYQVVKISRDCVKGDIRTVIANKLSYDEANCLAFNRNAPGSRFDTFKVEVFDSQKLLNAFKKLGEDMADYEFENLETI